MTHEHGDDRDGSEVPTVGDHLHDWLELQRTRLQPSTWRSYRGNVERYLAPHVGHLRLDELTVARLDRLYQELVLRGGHNGKPLAIRTVAYAHTVLRSALEDARRTGLIEDNVARDATLPRVDPRTGATAADRTFTVWTAEELRRFLAFVAEHRFAPLFTLAAGTGLRRGELLGLTWADVDLQAPTLRVQRALSVVDGQARLKTTKTGRPRTIHLDPRTVAALEDERSRQDDARARAGERWSNPWDLVFTTDTGGYVEPDAVTATFRTLVRAAPVPRIRLHDLRHTHATLLLCEVGVPVKVVSERLGHANIQITLDTYAHVLPAMDRDAAQGFSAAVWGQDE